MPVSAGSRLWFALALCLAALALLGSILFARPAAAQSAETTATPSKSTPAASEPAPDYSATQMKVSVWPEYDDPRTLVIMQADLDPSTKLPLSVSYNIPKGAEIGMACEIDAGGGHNCKTYQQIDKGDYQTITYEIQKERKIFLEFYYDAFPAGTTGQRDFTYTFRPAFNVASLDLEVQEPARSTGFKTTPDLAQVQTDKDGLKYHDATQSNVTVGKPIDVKVSYSKSDNKTSVKPKDKDARSSAAPSGTNAASTGAANTRPLYVILAVVGIAALFFGGYRVLRPAPVGGRYTRTNRRPARNTRKRNEVVPAAAALARGGSRPSSGRGGSKGSKFCTSCGSAIRRQDTFCSECGEEQA